MSTHILNVAFDFDDAKITKTIEEKAFDSAMEAVKKDVIKVIATETSRYHYNADADYRDGLKAFVQNAVKEVVESERERIVQMAVDKIAEKLAKTKAVREAAA